MMIMPPRKIAIIIVKRAFLEKSNGKHPEGDEDFYKLIMMWNHVAYEVVSFINYVPMYILINLNANF